MTGTLYCMNLKTKTFTKNYPLPPTKTKKNPKKIQKSLSLPKTPEKQAALHSHLKRLGYAFLKQLCWTLGQLVWYCCRLESLPKYDGCTSKGLKPDTATPERKDSRNEGGINWIQLCFRIIRILAYIPVQNLSDGALFPHVHICSRIFPVGNVLGDLK